MPWLARDGCLTFSPHPLFPSTGSFSFSQPANNLQLRILYIFMQSLLQCLQRRDTPTQRKRLIRAKNNLIRERALGERLCHNQVEVGHAASALIYQMRKEGSQNISLSTTSIESGAKGALPVVPITVWICFCKKFSFSRGREKIYIFFAPTCYAMLIRGS